MERGAYGREGTNPFPRNALLWVHIGCGPAYSDFHNEQPKACLLIEFGKGVIMYGVWIIVHTSSLTINNYLISIASFENNTQNNSFLKK